MELTGEARADLHLVTVNAARIDAAAAIQFKDAFREAVAGVQGRILLDLGAVDFLDSSGLGAVVAAMKMLTPGQKLEIACLTPSVEKVFRLTRMDTVFSIHASVDAALSGSDVA